MSFEILNSADDLVPAMRAAIESSIEGSVAEVRASSPGHFEIAVRSNAFAGKTRVEQQQMVYGAIAGWMKGDDAPVHAVDRITTTTA